MNSELYGKSFPLPDEVRAHLRSCSERVPDAHNNMDGFRRNKELQNAKSITYQQLKRIKNWFDGFSGEKDHPEHILNGGDLMRDWVDRVLTSGRDDANSRAERKKDFITPSGEYSDLNVGHVPHNDQFTPSVNESIIRINEIMKQLE